MQRVERHAGDPGLTAQLLDWSRAALPREACGFLLGIDRPGRIEVCAVVRARNAAEGVDAFLLGPDDVVQADRRARDAGLELVGFWHSHPRAAAVPSASDERAAWPGHLCVIVGLGAEPEIRAWMSVGGRLVELPHVLHAER